MKITNSEKAPVLNKRVVGAIAGMTALVVMTSAMFLMSGCKENDKDDDAVTTDPTTVETTDPVTDDTTVADTTVADTDPVEVAPGEDEVPYSDLVWSYGGENLPNAQLCEARITDLVVTDNMMSYKWLSGGCEVMGASNAHDHDNTLACLFVQGPDGVWRGGKFEWISTDRLTRELKNIKKEPYKGWPKDIFDDAQGVAFVIVANNGKLRTNVIRAK